MSKTVLALVAPTLVALAGCSTLQASDARPPGGRRAAVERWLADPGDPAIEGQAGVTWVVQDSTGTTVRVDVYLYLESDDLLPPDQGEARWGVACRSYDVAAAVETTTVACPAGTPGTP